MAIEKQAPPVTNSGMRSNEGSIEEQLAALEAGALDLSAFPHAEHLRLGYEMLARYSFGEAIARYSRGLKLLVAKAGKPEVYNETMTVAFLALIGERRTRAESARWSDFVKTNPDLLDKRCLERRYNPEQLASESARQTFCLPRPARPIE